MSAATHDKTAFVDAGVFMTRERVTEMFEGTRRLEVVEAGGEGDYAGQWSWAVLEDEAGHWHFRVSESCFPQTYSKVDDAFSPAASEVEALRMVAQRLLAAVAVLQGEPERPALT
jgi:hypothetical protein